MSYVKANTSPTFGSRAQALRPLHLAGWYNGPYPVYGQPASIRLNGEFNPQAAPPSNTWDGMRTYRINPATGHRQFYTTDIRPRGVFSQNTFQHPQQLSALGTMIHTAQRHTAAATSVLLPAPHPSAVRRMSHAIARRQANGPRVALRPGTKLSGCSSTCHCGGHCAKGLGDAPTGTQMTPYGVDQAGNPVFIDNDGNVYDADGNVMTDLSGVSTGIPGLQNGQPLVNGQVRGSNGTGGGGGQQIINAIQQAGNLFSPTRQTAAAPTSASSSVFGWFNGNTSIGGYSVPNTVLTVGAALLGITVMEGKGRRR